MKHEKVIPMEPVSEISRIESEIIPKMLKVIEESGISYYSASFVPEILKRYIEECTQHANKTLRFTIPI